MHCEEMCKFSLPRPTIAREKKCIKKYFVTIDDDGNRLRAAGLPVVYRKKKKEETLSSDVPLNHAPTTTTTS